MSVYLRENSEVLCYHVSSEVAFMTSLTDLSVNFEHEGALQDYALNEHEKRRVESIAIPDWLTLAPGVQTKPRVETVVPCTLDRIIGMLSVAAEELPDCPFYFQSDKLCSTIRTTVPKMSLL
ncbi:hypothetical protein ACTXT7_003320, partial [Hymenolepis weldensis]